MYRLLGSITITLGVAAFLAAAAEARAKPPVGGQPPAARPPQPKPPVKAPPPPARPTPRPPTKQPAAPPPAAHKVPAPSHHTPPAPKKEQPRSKEPGVRKSPQRPVGPLAVAPRAHTGKVDLRSLPPRGERFSDSPRGKGAANFAGAFAGAMQGLNDYSIRFRARREMENLAPVIRKQMPPGGGVLVIVSTAEHRVPNPTEPNATMFLSVSIAGAGPNREAVEKKYDATPGVSVAPPKDWIKREQRIWLTAKDLQAPPGK